MRRSHNLGTGIGQQVSEIKRNDRLVPDDEIANAI